MSRNPASSLFWVQSSTVARFQSDCILTHPVCVRMPKYFPPLGFFLKGCEGSLGERRCSHTEYLKPFTSFCVLPQVRPCFQNKNTVKKTQPQPTTTTPASVSKDVVTHTHPLQGLKVVCFSLCFPLIWIKCFYSILFILFYNQKNIVTRLQI